MLIFNDRLRKHNQAQPRYEPPRPAAGQEQTNNADKPSVSFSNPSAPSVNPATTNTTESSSAPLSASRTPSTTPPTRTYSASAQSDRSLDGQSPSNSRSSNISTATKRARSSQTNSNSQGSGSLAANKLFASSMAPKQTSRTPPPFQKPKAHKIILHKAPVTKLIAGAGAATATKDSAPSVAQTPVAVIGNSNSVPSERRKLGSPNSRSSHGSMAKTIAEHTPHGFKTLGPGFNNRAPAEKSLNLNPGDGHSLSSTIVPSDYEHIYHAPSQITDLPGVDDKSQRRTTQQAKKKQQEQHHHHHHRTRGK